MSPLHGPEALPPEFGRTVAEWMQARVEHAPLGRPVEPSEMYPLLDGTITASGLGVDAAWQRFVERVAPNTVSLDSERYLAFIPVSPSAAGVWMEAAVGAATFSAERSCQTRPFIARVRPIRRRRALQRHERSRGPDSR